MANVPIVTEVTKTQLDALVLANELNEGLQYKVTDKGWLLLATGNNNLVAVKNVLLITNGDILPTYVEANTLIIATGVIGEVPVGPILISVPTGYEIISMRVKNNASFINLISVYDADEENELFRSDISGLFDIRLELLPFISQNPARVTDPEAPLLIIMSRIIKYGNLLLFIEQATDVLDCECYFKFNKIEYSV